MEGLKGEWVLRFWVLAGGEGVGSGFPGRLGSVPGCRRVAHAAVEWRVLPCCRVSPGAGVALCASFVTVMGACKLFPRFNKSLSVSGRTALIVTPAFGSFFLLAELKLNEWKKQRRQK